MQATLEKGVHQTNHECSLNRIWFWSATKISLISKKQHPEVHYIKRCLCENYYDKNKAMFTWNRRLAYLWSKLDTFQDKSIKVLSHPFLFESSRPLERKCISDSLRYNNDGAQKISDIWIPALLICKQKSKKCYQVFPISK